MGLRRKNGRSQRSSHLGVLPLTSMIDVVFLLLVYFLVTSNFAQPERDISSAVQSEGGGVQVSELQPQIIDIRNGENGTIVFQIGSHSVGDQESLRAVLSSLPKEPGVAIRARKDVPIRAVAAAMQASQDAGFIRRSYVPSEE